MSIAKYTPQKAIELRRSVIDSIQGIGSIDMEICKSSTKTPIKEMDLEKIGNLAENLFNGLHIMIGLNRKVSKDEKQMSLTFITKYHNDLSFIEIRTAFELLALGELDEYLNKRDGVAERSHFQVFSMEYVGKVLGAYKKRLNKAWKNAYAALPPPSNELTEQDKQENRKEIEDRLIRAYVDYRDKQKEPSFIIPRVYYDILVEWSLLNAEDMPEVKAKAAAGMSKISSLVSEISGDYRVSKVIKDRFNELIKEEHREL